jgi:hypothetical protein
MTLEGCPALRQAQDEAEVARSGFHGHDRSVGAAFLSLLLAVGAGSYQPGGESPPTELAAARADAQRLLDGADPCSAEDLGPILQLLRNYGRRPEPQLRLLTAQARFHAGWVNWFHEREAEARNWFVGITRLYGHEEALPVQRLVAASYYLLARTGHDRSERARYLDLVLSRYAATDDLELLQTYANALYGAADLARERGDAARSAELVRQAGEIYSRRIIPRLPPVNENRPICV